jgi:uncharacterized protein YbjT (DUF2867 family)
MKVLVYGGTGSQGSAVVRNLLKRDHQPIILTRNPEKAQPMVEMGAATVMGDMENADSLVEATAAVDAVALMAPAFVPNPMLVPMYVQNAINAAQQAGNKFIVYNTSGPVIEERTGQPAYDMRLDILAMLRDSGVPHVVVQPTAYMENLLGPWTRPNIIAHDTLSYPVDDHVRLGWIATEDVGALIAAALEHPEYSGERFKVSGLENVTGPELAERMSVGLGRSIRYYAMPLEAFGAALDAAFGPGAGAGGIAGYQFQRDNADKISMYADMTPVLEKLPVQMTSIAQWAAQHRMAFQ